VNSQATAKELVCDGCGLEATPEHIAKRLRRLELTTRYRPIHLQVVFLGAQSPKDEKDFLYAAAPEFGGEGATLLRALGIASEGRPSDVVLAEFQRRGFLLTHVLECPAEQGRDNSDLTAALQRKLPSVVRRLRGSLRPKRMILITKDLTSIVEELKRAEFGGELVLNNARPFDLDDADSVSQLTSAFRGL